MLDPGDEDSNPDPFWINFQESFMFINVIDVNNRRLCPTRKLKWVNKMISENKADINLAK